MKRENSQLDLPCGWFEIQLQNGPYSGQRGLGLAAANNGWRVMVWIPQLSSYENCGKTMERVGEMKNWFYVYNLQDITLVYSSDSDRKAAIEKIWAEYEK